MIKYFAGDLFTSDAPILAHGCNTAGKMGAGIAKTFKERYFDMFKKYRDLCGEGKFNVGQGFIYNTQDGRYIFNLATQGSLQGARIEYIESAFNWMRKEMIELNTFHAAIPKIGCGLGGLDWEQEVLPVLQDIFKNGEYLIEVWEINE